MTVHTIADGDGWIAAPIEYDKRHLHWSAEDARTVCGCARWVSFRTGSRIYREPGYPSVHFSKARKGDCSACRQLVRCEITSSRRLAETIAPIAVEPEGCGDPCTSGCSCRSGFDNGSE